VAIIDWLKRLRGNSQPAAPRPARTRPTPGQQPPRALVRIEFDMMLKGSVYDRPTGRVKQFGVTVDGSTRVITSGDFVDRETYEALLKAGAIRPKSDNPPDAPAPPLKKRHREAS
jgi:hypothetical protein